MGIKPCDLLAAPLCAEHHREIHKRGMVAERGKTATDAELWKAIALTLRAYHLQETA